MSDTFQIAATGDALRARAERLRMLKSAWAALAPFALSPATQHIVDTGRAISEDLADLASRAPEERDPAALPKLDKLLTAIETEMRALAYEVPVGQLRSILPGRLARDRRAVLDLLDVMLVAELEGQDGSAGRMSALDYLITLLCTGGVDGDGSVLEDPVGLTTHLFELCERAGDGADLAGVEAEFYAAANVNEGDAREELQMRALRRRKIELGSSFFAPRVLRAIVSYNAAMSRCLDRGVWDSRDWGSLAAQSEHSEGAESVFDAEAMPRLAEALRRRADGQAPSSSAVDRVAWCLDLASLGEVERAALLTPTVGQSGDLEGTAMLVGLLCRSAVVLGDELPAIGIPPERLRGDWVRELDSALKRVVNDHIASDRYDAGRALTELRNTFLYSLMKGDQRERPRREAPAESLLFERVEQEAQQLAEEAVEEAMGAEASPVSSFHWKQWRTWPWRGMARFGSAVALAALAALALTHVFFSGDLDRMWGAELESVSRYLERGARNDDGNGTSFVGTIDDAWIELSPVAQRQSAAEMVRALRARGVREIMVYDGDRHLRIQALGERPVRVIAPEGS